MKKEKILLEVLLLVVACLVSAIIDFVVYGHIVPLGEHTFLLFILKLIVYMPITLLIEKQFNKKEKNL